MVTDLVSEEYNKDVIFIHFACAQNVETVQALLFAFLGPIAYHVTPR